MCPTSGRLYIKFSKKKIKKSMLLPKNFEYTKDVHWPMHTYRKRTSVTKFSTHTTRWYTAPTKLTACILDLVELLKGIYDHKSKRVISTANILVKPCLPCSILGLETRRIYEQPRIMRCILEIYSTQFRTEPFGFHRPCTAHCLCMANERMNGQTSLVVH